LYIAHSYNWIKEFAVYKIQVVVK